jgi:hypothetical protein
MGHPPNIGHSSKMEELIGPAPGAQVLGTIKDSITDPQPQGTAAAWTRDDGTPIELVEPPPPWELEDKGHADSDARRFVDVPKEWSLRWINPRLLDSLGWRYWQPVMASDPRVKVKVPSMVDVANNIRRGGHTGDVLGWMYTAWVESRWRQRREQTAQLTQSAVERQESLREEFKRGAFGPYVAMADARHPTHTMAEGRSMRD